MLKGWVELNITKDLKIKSIVSKDYLKMHDRFHWLYGHINFTADELGIKVSSLRNAKASRRTYSNKLVMISRVRLHSKPNKAGERASIPPASDKPG
jgi:hypothetical protein